MASRRRLNWWTNGFWGGILWLLYQDTGEERYARIARVSEKKMEQCFRDFYGLYHDVGFMFVPMAVADFRLTGNPDSRRIAMHAAAILAGRFNPVGRFIRAWNDLEEDTRGWAIIDCLFNLSLLYWASEESGDPRFRQIAMMHADTVRENFVRPDGSVCHIVEFDPETGRKVRSLGGQGYGEGSSWTRGQGWALYGFTISFLHTGKLLSGLEPGWHSHSYSCTYQWSYLFPQPEEKTKELEKEGYKVNLWEHVFVYPAAPFYQELISFSGEYEVWNGLVPDFATREAVTFAFEQGRQNRVSLTAGAEGHICEQHSGGEKEQYRFMV